MKSVSVTDSDHSRCPPAGKFSFEPVRISGQGLEESKVQAAPYHQKGQQRLKYGKKEC